MVQNTPASERAPLLRVRQNGALLRLLQARPLCAAAFALLFSLALLAPQSAHAQTTPTIAVSPSSVMEGEQVRSFTFSLTNIPVATDSTASGVSVIDRPYDTTVGSHIILTPVAGATELRRVPSGTYTAVGGSSFPHTVSFADDLAGVSGGAQDLVSLSTTSFRGSAYALQNFGPTASGGDNTITFGDQTTTTLDLTIPLDIAVVDDNLVEGTEYLSFCFSWIIFEYATTSPFSRSVQSQNYVCTQVSILDNDSVLIALTDIELPDVSLTADQTIAEGETTTYTFTMVDRAGAPHPTGAGVEVRMAWEIDGETGSSGLCSADTTCEALAGRTGTVTFAPGQTSAVLAVNAPDSAEDYAHDSETDFWALELGALTCAGGTCGAADQADVRLHPLAQGRKRDYAKQLGGGVGGGGDAAEPAPLNLGISAAGPTSVEEGNPARFVLSLTGGVSTEDVAITYRINNIDSPPGTAPDSADYGAPESPGAGLSFPATGEMTLSAGTQRATFEIPLTLDTLDEPDESFSVELLTATGGVSAGVEIGTPIATATIVNVENAPYVLRLAGPAAVAEGGTATYRVFTENDVSSSRQVVVTYRIEGTATSNRDTTQFLNTVSSLVNPPDPTPDYEAPAGAVAQCSGMEAGAAAACSATSTDNTVYLEGTLIIPEDQASLEFSIPTMQDLADDDDETLVVRLVSASGGSTLSPPELSATAANIRVSTTITDDDTAPLNIDLTLSDTAILETAAPQGGQVITVTATLRPGATRDNQDQGAAPGVGPGEDTPTTDTISLEQDVTVQLFLLQDEAAAVLAPYGGIKLAVQAGSPLSTTRCASLPTGNECNDFEVTGADGAATLDMPAIVIRAGHTSATASFNLNLLNDEVVEMDEAIVVDGTASGTAGSFDVHHDQITIESDDEAFLTVSASPNPTEEGETLDFTVTLSHQVDGMVEVDALSRCGSWVNYVATDAECKTGFDAEPRPAFRERGTGADALEEPDFTDVAASAAMVFSANAAPADRAQAFSVRLVDDDYSEPEETFHLALENPVLLPPPYLSAMVATAWDSGDAARDISIGRTSDGGLPGGALCSGCSADAVIAASDPIVIQPVAPGQGDYGGRDTAWVLEGDTADFGVRLVNGDGGGRVLPTRDLTVSGTIQRSVPPTFYGAEGCTVDASGAVGGRAVGVADYTRFNAGADTAANALYTAGQAGLPAEEAGAVTWTFRGHSAATPAGAPATGELVKTRTMQTCENMLDDDDHNEVNDAADDDDHQADAGFYTNSRRRFHFDLYGAAGGAVPEGADLLSISEEEVTTVIKDDDTLVVSVELSKNSLREQDADDNGAGGDDSLTMKVSLLRDENGDMAASPAGFAAGVTLTLSFSEDSYADRGEDYTVNDETGAVVAGDVVITIPVGALEGENFFTINVLDDDLDDDEDWIIDVEAALTCPEDGAVPHCPSPEEIHFVLAPAAAGDIDPEGTDSTIELIDDDDPNILVTFEVEGGEVSEDGDLSVEADEGSSLEIVVRLSADPERPVAIPILHAGVNGATPSGAATSCGAPTLPPAAPCADYTLRGPLSPVGGYTPLGTINSPSVFFSPGETEKSFVIDIGDDQHAETRVQPGATPADPPEIVREGFQVGLGLAAVDDARFAAGEHAVLTVHIDDNDFAPRFVRGAPPAPNVPGELQIFRADDDTPLPEVQNGRIIAYEGEAITFMLKAEDLDDPTGFIFGTTATNSFTPAVANAGFRTPCNLPNEERAKTAEETTLSGAGMAQIGRCVFTWTPTAEQVNSTNNARANTQANGLSDAVFVLTLQVFDQAGNPDQGILRIQVKPNHTRLSRTLELVLASYGRMYASRSVDAISRRVEAAAAAKGAGAAAPELTLGGRSLPLGALRGGRGGGSGGRSSGGYGRGGYGGGAGYGGRGFAGGGAGTGGRGAGAAASSAGPGGAAMPFLVGLADAFGLRLPDASLFYGGGANALRAPGAVPGLDAWDTGFADGSAASLRGGRVRGRTAPGWAEDFRSADASAYLGRVASWRRVSSRDLLNGASFAFSVGEEGGEGGGMEGGAGEGMGEMEGGENGGMMEDAPAMDAPRGPFFGRYNVWGRIDIDGFESEPLAGIALSGEGVSSYLGVDFHPRDNMLLGVAFSHSEGEVDYSNSVDQIVPGTWELEITSAMPYLHIAPNPGLGIFAMVGFGSGSANITLASEQQTRTDAQTLSTDLEMQMAALGMRNALRAIGDVDLSLKADAFVVDLVSKESAELPEVSGDAMRMRLMLEGKRSWVSEDTQRSTQLSLEVGARRDGGDADEGLGAEIGAAFQYRDLQRGLSVRLRGHSIVMHAEDEFREWGAGVDVAYDPGLGGEGFSMTLTPTFGAASSGAAGVFENDDLFERAAAGKDGGASRAARRGRLDAGFGYHLRLFGGRGVLEPFAVVGLGGADTRKLRIGTRLDLSGVLWRPEAPVPGTAMHIELFGERRTTQASDGGDAERRIGVDLQVSF